jgi:hypothetical protein|tara:strand:+ start:2982 stop:5171 length:2190 start_codon:yes stop_codon:yes gene_type:complete
MKKILFLIFFAFIFILTASILYLSIFGVKTSKFNNLIIEEIKKKDSAVKLELNTVTIKFDIKKIQIFLSTDNPKITYQDIKIPVTEIKIYSKINKILDSKIELSQIIFRVKKFKINNIQKIAVRIKPSNFKTYFLNNLNEGEIEKALFNIKIGKNFELIEYKANGTIKKVNAKIKNGIEIKNIGFNFIVDNNLSLINSINANYEGILISNGSIELQRETGIEIKGKFNSQLNINKNQLNKIAPKVKFFKKNNIEIEGSLLHEFNLKFNKNLKVLNYEYKSSGEILRSQIILSEVFKNNFIEKNIQKILFKKTKVEIAFKKKGKNLLLLDGLYSTDEKKYKKFQIKHNLEKKNQEYFIDLDLSENILINLINFQVSSNKSSNIKSEFSIKNDILVFKTIDLTEGKNSISIKGLILNKKNEIKNFISIKVLTFNKGEENNNFMINFGKKISVSGKKYDSTNLLQLLSKDSKSNPLKNFNKEVEIELKSLITKSKIPLSNFNLLGLIEKGKLNKISSKSEFSNNKYLDISLKKDPNNKKILEVYSDLPQVFLIDYNFFEGIRDGTLLYTSVIDKKGSASKIIIENFKIIKAPIFATLLTLADLRGFADILSGQGMSFDILEINLRDDDNLTTIDEILALGSSVSLQMEGYIEKKTGLISLKGTLVPAKTLNNLVLKIPVIGNILVGNKVGEGVFGVSFKIKGLPGEIKTTVNPIKTLTPRFITRALEKMKKK